MTRNPIKIVKKDKAEQKKEPTEKEDLRNNLLTHFQKMHMPKINHGPGLVPQSAVVVTGKNKLFYVNLDVKISSNKFKVIVSARYNDDESKEITKKVYKFSYPVEFPITDDILGRLDLSKAWLDKPDEVVKSLKKYLSEVKEDQSQEDDSLPVYKKLDDLALHVQKETDKWFNTMIHRQIATIGRETATLDDVYNFWDLHCKMLKFDPNNEVCYYLLGDKIEKPTFTPFSTNGISKLIIAARDKMRQKWKEILYPYIMNYYRCSIKMRDLLRIEKFGQYLPPLDEDETIHYLIMNIWDFQFITLTRFHATLRREFLRLIYVLRKTTTMKESDISFKSEIFMFMETFVRASLYRSFHHDHKIVDWCMLIYPQVGNEKLFLELEDKISEETSIKKAKRLAYKQFLLVWEIGNSLYHKDRENKLYEDTKVKQHWEKKGNIYAEDDYIYTACEFPMLTEWDFNLLRNPSMSINKMSLEVKNNEGTEQSLLEENDADMVNDDKVKSNPDPDVDGLRLWLSALNINSTKEADNKEKLITSRRAYVKLYQKTMMRLIKNTRFDLNRNRRCAIQFENLDKHMAGSSNDEEEN